jgi:hypothetical protein
MQQCPGTVSPNVRSTERQGRVRPAVGSFDATTGRGRHPASTSPEHQFVEEPGLPRTGLADQEHGATVALLQPVQPLVERRDHTIPPDQRAGRHTDPRHGNRLHPASSTTR